MDKNIIKLVNVSKFYYNKGVIASGFTKVNVSFKIGEFVAITGDSGSGKSTLLNVISGLDTYEEGEMYINGQETSHYSQADFENYRRKYISNIFQNFNLINSYTVYQNIELVLLLNGYTKRNVKNKILELIEKVGLTKFKNTKVSKLSGGQKQRVAIARALAKDTPIIIADEPTGNLDSKSAKEIIELLYKISKDKLVIIVTHNFEQVEKYVTRKIKMHDGKILEDRTVKKVEEEIKPNISNYKDIRFISKLRLGIRNTFNITSKFLLVLAIYLFVTMALMTEYSSFKKQEYISDKMGYNYYFGDLSDNRIIIKKKDKTSFTEEDYNKINSIGNVKSVLKNDLLLDTQISMTDDNYWIYGNANSLSNFSGELDKGRMPTNDNEVILVGSKDDYYLGIVYNEILEKEFNLENMYTGEVSNIKLKVAGIKYDENITDVDAMIYVSDKIEGELTYQINQQYSNLKVLFMNKYNESNYYDINYKIIPNNMVPQGTVYIPSDLNYMCKNENCNNQPLTIELENIYYKDNLNLKVSNSYNQKNFKKLLGLENYEENKGAIFINSEDYNSLFNKAPYQSSVYVNDVLKIDDAISELNSLGMETLKIKDTLMSYGSLQVIQIFKTVVTVILVVVLFFISYFVLRIVLKSRNVYFSTLRMLGATKKISIQLLITELLNAASIAYFLFLGFIYLNKINVLNFGFVGDILTYFTFKEYIIIYLILLIMSYLTSLKFGKKLFKNSMISTIQEEV